MALFGYRVSQRSVLWPLVGVLLPAWVAIVWLSRNAAAAQEMSTAAGPSAPKAMLLVTALLIFFPALLLLFRHPWARFVWAERVQALWPLALVLLALSLRGVGAQAGKFVVDFINRHIVGALQWETEPSFRLLLELNSVGNALVALGLVWMVREIVVGKLGRLHEVLGYDVYDFMDWRLWLVALGVGLPLGLLGGGVGQLPTGLLGMLVSLRMLLLAPFVEEVIYRGFLLPALRNWCGPWLAAVLVSALYAGLQTHLSPAGIAPAVVQSLVLCFIKLKTGRLALAMMAHAIMGLAAILIGL
jgi:membrane protease YdiL (CAAX protease family)